MRKNNKVPPCTSCTFAQSLDMENPHEKAALSALPAFWIWKMRIMQKMQANVL